MTTAADRDPTSLGALVRHWAARFAAAGIDTARLDARLLVAAALGVDGGRVITHPEQEVSAADRAAVAAMAARRERREPVSHILGRRGFWTLDLEVTADTLDPRPDTETLVRAVLDRIGDRTRPVRLLDFGTGSGAILLALLSELPAATGLGIDASAAALAVAARNATACGLGGRARFQLGDWGTGLVADFDVIVSNPPYIPDADIDALEPEVARFEPRSALAGGKDGLDCYRRLLPDIARLLAPAGVAAMEVGAGQAPEVAALFTANGLQYPVMVADFAGIERVVIGGA